LHIRTSAPRPGAIRTSVYLNGGAANDDRS
jgi:hypothetical protein